MLEDILTAARPLTLIAGAAGTGKTSLLALLSDQFLVLGRHVTAIRCTARGEVVPIRFSPSEHTTRLPIPDRAGPTLSPVPGAADDKDLARRVAVTIAGQLPRDGVLLIDDAHWLAPDALAVLRALVRGRTRCVCAGLPWPKPALRELRAADLVDEFRLPPRPRRAIAREVTRLLAATPEPALVERVRELGRGLPAALRDTVEALHGNGSIQIVERNAYLVRRHTALAPAPDNQLVEAIRKLGDDCWAVAKAMAVLAPLGPAAPALLAEELGMSEVDVAASLELLREAGVLHNGRSWRFIVPLVKAALLACLGPFERQHLSAALVTAVWSNTAACADKDHLADRIADAGALVDSDRALRELLHRADAARYDRPEAALRWLAAARDLAQDDRRRAKVQLMHTLACFAIGDHKQGLSGAQGVLTEYADLLSPEDIQELQAMVTAALGAAGDHEALRELASGQSPAGGAELSTVTRALAFCLLDRWHAASTLLRETESQWRAGNPHTVMLGELAWALAELWSGSPARFEHRLANRRDWPQRSVRRHLRDQVAAHATALLVTGDSDRAMKLMAEAEIEAGDLPLDCQSMLAAADGQAERALDLARRSIAGAETRSYLTRSAGMYVSAVSVLVARGELATARQLLDAARTTPPALAHLLDLAAARIDRAFGDEQSARTQLLRCAESGLTAGIDIAWSELVDLALVRGDRTEARRGLAELEQLPKTSRATMLTLLARATVENDHAAARECERLVRERAQPLEQAIVLERLVKHGGAEPNLLTEAYELLGTLDAVLYRAWSRNLMHDHGVPVPGRKETVAENERVLAMLAADGLTNKQLGAALRTSDKSVEGRLSRLFLRTGYRSRIELSAAILNGEYRADS